MKERKNRKANIRLIVNALLTGRRLKSKDICGMISEASGIPLNVPEVTSIISRLSDSSKSNLGYFIIREPEGSSYNYKLVDELLQMPEAKVYGLSIKKGEEAFPLEKALAEMPDLKKYVDQAVVKEPKRRKLLGDAVKPGKKRGRKSKLEKIGMGSLLKWEDYTLEQVADVIVRKINELGGLNLNVRFLVPEEEVKH